MIAPGRPGHLALGGDQGHVVEDGGERGRLGPHEPLRWVVDKVQDIGPAGAQHPPDGDHHLPGGKVPGHGQAAECIPDHDVEGAGRLRIDAEPAVALLDTKVRTGAQAQLPPSQADQGRVQLEDDAGRSGPGGSQPAGHGEAAAADMQHRQRPRRRSLDDRRDGLGVAELEVGGVGQVDVAVTERVQPQDPARRPIRVLLDPGAEVDAGVGAPLGDDCRQPGAQDR